MNYYDKRNKEGSRLSLAEALDGLRSAVIRIEKEQKQISELCQALTEEVDKLKAYRLEDYNGD